MLRNDAVKRWPRLRPALAVLLAISLLGATGLLAEPQSPPPTIAIIIDDMGVQLDTEKRLLALDHPLTLSFLPHRPYTRYLAETANDRGKEVMLHAPMANMGRIGLGPGGLDVGMDEREITRTLRHALASVPHAAGVNNHMGSLLTQKQEPMEWVMDELSLQNLYFLDSRTIATTVAEEVARSRDLPTMSRDVFLDNVREPEAIDRQFNRLIDKARENGTAIAIGHPYEVTVEYLEEMLPRLDEKGIAVATISGLWRIRHDNQPMFRQLPPEPTRLVQIEED